MASSPDFKINHNYLIWVTPQRNVLEVIIQGQNKYTKLAEKNSKILYEIITDKKVSNLFLEKCKLLIQKEKIFIGRHLGLS
jgi:hypothetical protein